MAGVPVPAGVPVLAPVPVRVRVRVREREQAPGEPAAESGPRCTTAAEAPGEAWATGRREPAAAPVPSRGSARAPSPRRLLRRAS
jgi:hypothetical protein